LTAAEFPLRMTDGTVVLCPASLDAVTTYVLLEQERWFEKEAGFLQHWLRPGMMAIDIGANLGVYALSMARRVGPEGRVFAYEPGSVARGFLMRSAVHNGVGNLQTLPFALSQARGIGHLLSAHSTELNALSQNGAGEEVELVCLDEEDRIRDWRAPDFVKLDAEGEETRIVAGGQAFFTDHDPLVMFEVRQAEKVNEPLIAAFRSLGYAIYRALPFTPLLLPFAEGEEIDGYELNLFAAKPPRAAALAREGFLLGALPQWQPDDTARSLADSYLRAQPFAAEFGPLFGQPVSPDYHDALAGYALWRAADQPPELRCAALRYATGRLFELCQQTRSLARLSTFARVAWEAGRRSMSVVALQAFAQFLRGGGLDEAFLPPTPRYDHIPPGTSPRDWFLASAFELYDRSKNLSSFWGASGVDLDWLSHQPFADTETERRRLLLALRAGRRLPIPERLRQPAADHLNAEIWRAGLVPNSI
jgi:FkbM family methyltransferase